MEVDEAKRAGQSGPQEIDLEEKRRLDHLESMDKIEKEFSEVKEKLFQEKMTSLDEEMKKVEAGTMLAGGTRQFTYAAQELTTVCFSG